MSLVGRACFRLHDVHVVDSLIVKLNGLSCNWIKLINTKHTCRLSSDMTFSTRSIHSATSCCCLGGKITRFFVVFFSLSSTISNMASDALMSNCKQYINNNISYIFLHKIQFALWDHTWIIVMGFLQFVEHVGHFANNSAIIEINIFIILWHTTKITFYN